MGRARVPLRLVAVVTLPWKGAGNTTGPLDGITFTMNKEGMGLVYPK